MPRSLKKGPFVDQRLVGKIKKLGPDSKEIIKTWKRSCTIVPEMIGFSFGVHNGKNFIAVKVSEDMVGHKLGEFSPTTKFGKHGGKMQKGLESKETEKEAVKVKEFEKAETKPTK
ncbi:MAG: 30S ribosomal protein S19 [Patescibacteria group bacterium]